MSDKELKKLAFSILLKETKANETDYYVKIGSHIPDLHIASTDHLRDVITLQALADVMAVKGKRED